MAALGLFVLLPTWVAGNENLSAGEPKHVLLIESFGRDLAPWNSIMPALKRDLAQQLPWPIEFHEASWGTVHADAPGGERAFADYLRYLYAEQNPDLLIAVGGAAAQVWWRMRESVFPSTPVVVGGIEHRVMQQSPTRRSSVSWRSSSDTGSSGAG